MAVRGEIECEEGEEEEEQPVIPLLDRYRQRPRRSFFAVVILLFVTVRPQKGACGLGLAYCIYMWRERQIDD